MDYTLQHEPPSPFELSDRQADAVLQVIKPMRPAERRAFLQRLADRLDRLHCAIDDVLLARAIERSRQP